jgi:hypothetical protein
VIVRVATGLGSGLAGTLVRVSHERTNEVRQRALETSQDFAAAASRWIVIVNEAINARWQHGADTDSSDANYAAARAAVDEAQSAVSRLLVVLPQRSVAARSAIGVTSCLEEAIGELEIWPPGVYKHDPRTPGDDEEEPLSEDESAEYFHELEQEGMLEAKMWKELAESALGNFIYDSAGELRAGAGAVARRAWVRIVQRRRLWQRALRRGPRVSASRR